MVRAIYQARNCRLSCLLLCILHSWTFTWIPICNDRRLFLPLYSRGFWRLRLSVWTVFVYGVTVDFIIIFIVPIYKYLISRFNYKISSIVWLYIISLIISIVFETGMGLIFNQPVDGHYPMWDNSQMPGNILNQGWIVNDLLYAVIIVIFVIFVYPLIQVKLLNRLSNKEKIVNAIIVVIIFLINIYITYGIFHE